MQFDPENKVIQLCARGMEAEFAGKNEDAHALFREAWNLAQDPIECFTAAHYLARQQKDPRECLKWNEEALRQANLVEDPGMLEHFPSLYLNLARSHELLGDLETARKFYNQAAESCDQLPGTKYAEMIRVGIREGLKRTGQHTTLSQPLADLINNWCDEKNLKALALVLPTWVSSLDSGHDINRLVSALSYLSASRSLNEKDQAILEGIILDLSSKLQIPVEEKPGQ